MNLNAKTLEGAEVHFQINGLPDRCPQCHTAVHPKLISQHISGEESEVYLTLLCTSRRCLRPFVATYRQNFHNRSEYKFAYSGPRTVLHGDFPESIRKLSPTFCEICEQVDTAKANALQQLVGIGLRKALEFLVKDFSKHMHPNDSSAIDEMMLGKCIITYITDQNVLQCAKRAAWLGNDETHYVRKWSDKDVSDLALLVHLTQNWVENSMLINKYIQEMPDGV